MLKSFIFCCAALSAALSDQAHQNTAEKPHLERIEWTDIWVTDADKSEFPRVLLVGDSIVRGYFDPVEKNLRGKAACARYTTSAFMGNPDYLAELAILLGRYDFDVIHINNGLHGWEYTEAEYADSFSALVDLLQEHAPDAKIVWATTTPVRKSDDLTQFGENNARVRERNRIALGVMKDRGIPVNDLYELVEDHPEYFAPDGVHYNEKGRTAQGRQVADTILKYLPSPP